MKILLVVNPQKTSSKELAGAIKTELQKKGIKSAVFAYTDKFLLEDDFDAAFSLGGDGTVLFTARTVAGLKIPILPLNLGNFGFISSVSPADWLSVFEDYLAGKAPVSERMMLSVNILREGSGIFEGSALNDVNISASGIAKTIRLSVSTSVSGAETDIAYYRADGLIAATPTGSTAYSSSAGGPILDPEMEALILNPVCPFTLVRKPLVIPLNSAITVKIEKKQRSGILLTVDGQVTQALTSADEVILSRSPYKARLIASDKKAFYRAFHSKLALPEPVLQNEFKSAGDDDGRFAGGRGGGA